MPAINNNAETPLFIEFRPGMRKALADAVEAFLNLLDQIDADADLEEDNPPEDDAPCEGVGDDEPSLGAPGASSFPRQTLWAQGVSDDREDEHDGCEPDCDDENGGDEGEMNLGATTAINQERAWAESRGWPVDEGEPSLGWSHGHGHPEIALRGYDDEREENIGADERELDEAERSGCGDMDGVIEQHGFGVEYAG